MTDITAETARFNVETYEQNKKNKNKIILEQSNVQNEIQKILKEIKSKKGKNNLYKTIRLGREWNLWKKLLFVPIVALFFAIPVMLVFLLILGLCFGETLNHSLIVNYAAASGYLCALCFLFYKVIYNHKYKPPVFSQCNEEEWQCIVDYLRTEKKFEVNFDCYSRVNYIRVLSIKW